MDQVLDLPESERTACLDPQPLMADERAALSCSLVVEAEGRAFMQAPKPKNLLAVGECIGAWRVIEMPGSDGSGELCQAERADGNQEDGDQLYGALIEHQSPQVTDIGELRVSACAGRKFKGGPLRASLGQNP